MNYQILDLETYKRKSHFEYFSQLAYPYVGVTADVEITEFHAKIKEQRLPFFLSFCYCVAQAANTVPEFRQRILEGQIIQFDRCRTSHTVALEDGTYCYCTLDYSLPFPDFLTYAQKMQEAAKQNGSIAESEGDTLDLFYISTLPWISYSALIQPVPIPADSNPRITWGKFSTRDNRLVLPVSVLCHHALVDGRHLGQFYQALDQALAQLCAAL